MDWSLRGCSRSGHVTYAPAEPSLRDRLHVDTPAGEAWRCLRCATFVVGPPAGTGPAGDAPLVLRGKALKDATILRLLAAERLVRALLLLALGYGVLYFENAQTSVKQTFDKAIPAARPLARIFNYDLDASPTVERIRHLLDSRQHTLTLVAAGLFAYAALQLLEGVGLWLLKRWGEYVAVVGTSAFLPLEVYELTDKVSWLKAGALVVNVAAVVYLVWSKRLFGVRGGHAAFEAERQSESLLEVEAAATVSAGAAPATSPST
jgi:uncharacterized membrane protein (DUF2068 family)